MATVIQSLFENGRVTAFEMFDGDDADVALARFEEIGAATETERVRARVCRLVNARDWDGLGLGRRADLLEAREGSVGAHRRTSRTPYTSVLEQALNDRRHLELAAAGREVAARYEPHDGGALALRQWHALDTKVGSERERAPEDFEEGIRALVLPPAHQAPVGEAQVRRGDLAQGVPVAPVVGGDEALQQLARLRRRGRGTVRTAAAPRSGPARPPPRPHRTAPTAGSGRRGSC